MAIRVFPVDWKLVIRSGHNIRLDKDVIPAQLYAAIKAEFSDPACDVEGLVFHLEKWGDGKYETLKACKVRKRDFGIEWPPKATEQPKAEVPVTSVVAELPLPKPTVSGPGWGPWDGHW